MLLQWQELPDVLAFLSGSNSHVWQGATATLSLQSPDWGQWATSNTNIEVNALLLHLSPSVFLQGVMMLPASSLPKDDLTTPNASSQAAAAYKRLWVHEALRVFYDRLVDSNDRGWLLEQLRGIVSQNMGVGLDQLMAHLLQPDQPEVGQEQMRR